MNRQKSLFLALAAAFVAGQFAFAASASAQWRVTSDQTVGGYKWAESVACDAKHKVLYAGAFGTKLDPALKDGGGWISKVGLDGKIIEEKFLPAKGGEALSKPKGIWVQG